MVNVIGLGYIGLPTALMIPRHRRRESPFPPLISVRIIM